MTAPKEKVKTLKRSYGWRPDLPDHRDLLYAAVMRAPAPLPAKVDLRKFCSAVEDQGQLGSCTANALVGTLEFLELKGRSTPFADLSRLFVYYNERAIEGTVQSDSGAMLRDGIKALAKQGSAVRPPGLTSSTRSPKTGRRQLQEGRRAHHQHLPPPEHGGRDARLPGVRLSLRLRFHGIRRL